MVDERAVRTEFVIIILQRIDAAAILIVETVGLREEVEDAAGTILRPRTAPQPHVGDAIDNRLRSGGCDFHRGHLGQMVPGDGDGLGRGLFEGVPIDGHGEALAEGHRRDHEPEIDALRGRRPQGDRFGASQRDGSRRIIGHRHCGHSAQRHGHSGLARDLFALFARQGDGRHGNPFAVQAEPQIAAGVLEQKGVVGRHGHHRIGAGAERIGHIRLRGGQRETDYPALTDRCGFLIRIHGHDVRQRTARTGTAAHRLEIALGIAGGAEELILLVHSGLVEDGHPVVGRPSEQEVLIDIDPRPLLGRLLEGGVEHGAVRGSAEIRLLDGAGCHQRGGNPQV